MTNRFFAGQTDYIEQLNAIDVLGSAGAHIADTTGAHAATAISNTPAGNIAATTVQAAINELDTEKLSASATTLPSSFVNASLNSITPAGGTLDVAGNVTFAANTTASGYVASGAQIYSNGANIAHGASRISMSQDAASTSLLQAYGANTSTNGTLRLVSRRSDGSNAYNYDFSDTGAFIGGPLSVFGSISATTRVNYPSFTVATLPAVGSAGGNIYVSDESGGAQPAFSDGTNWRRYTDRAVVS